MNRYNNVKQKLEKKIGDIDKKIPDVSGLMTMTVLDTKIKEVDNKIPDLSGLIKKIDYEAKILEIKGKHLLLDYNKFMSNILDAKIRQKESVNKSEISSLIKILTET